MKIKDKLQKAINLSGMRAEVTQFNQIKLLDYHYRPYDAGGRYTGAVIPPLTCTDCILTFKAPSKMSVSDISRAISSHALRLERKICHYQQEQNETSRKKLDDLNRRIVNKGI